MASLITVRGPTAGRRYPLDEQATLIGRQPDAPVCLESLAVSRHHARIVAEHGGFFVEDLGSSNGTFVNGTRITGLVLLCERDILQIGPYELGLLTDPSGIRIADSPQVIRARVEAIPTNATLFAQNPAHKLQVVLEIAQHLGSTLELDVLLNQLLEQLFRLFSQADRGMVLPTTIASSSARNVCVMATPRTSPTAAPSSRRPSTREWAFSARMSVRTARWP